MQTTDNIMINQISSMRLNIDMDEGNQQTNKRRLQREIKALNKIIQQYKQQNNSLKQANETL